MGPSTLPTTVFNPGLSYYGHTHPSSPLDRRYTFNTIIEDEPQVTSPSFPYHLLGKPAMVSPTFSEDFPTPRGLQDLQRLQEQREAASPVSDSSEDYSGQRSPQEPQGYFDDLYDVSEDEAPEVPLKCSRSVKKDADSAHSSTTSSARSSRNRYPSLVIPSPSKWPTIQKFQMGALSATSPMKSPLSALLTPKAGVLSLLAAHSNQVPATSAPPSLDGSLTSDEMASLSCPSTPDVQTLANQESEWLPPAQLQPGALDTLHHISYEGVASEPSSVVEVSEGETAEMQEIRGPRKFVFFIEPPEDVDTEECFSPISIPSPGGFFSSLETPARDAWCTPRPAEDVAPSTSIAEHFYGVPWEDSPTESEKENKLMLDTTIPGTTHISGISSPQEQNLEIQEIEPRRSVVEYHERYEQKLKEVAVINLDRTTSWLSAQEAYLAALRDTDRPAAECVSPKSPHSRKKSQDSCNGSPSKKSVRFMDDLPKSPTESEKTITKNDTFVEGFEYLWDNIHESDVYIHRQTRAEYIHLNRRCTGSEHRNQLLGIFSIVNYVRPSAPRPVSSFYTDEPTVLKERIARAQLEQQALAQIRSSVWVLQALQFLHGGRLLSKQSCRALARTSSPRLLDVGGEAACSWAWKIAIDNPTTTVYTVNTADQMHSTDLEGPINHRVTTVPNLWTFPFPSAHFDVISARTLHMLLKSTRPEGKGHDEFDLCLAECFRCLKPGGILEFSVLDAEILHPGTRTQAMTVEFAYNLRTRGYESNPTKTFLSRLRRAGFNDVRRTWMLLPFGETAAKWNDNLIVGAEGDLEKTIDADGTVSSSRPPLKGLTSGAAGITGMVGAWAWEKWLLKLQLERGIEESRALDGVVQVLEEGAREGSAWRSLNGWARKPMH